MILRAAKRALGALAPLAPLAPRLPGDAREVRSGGGEDAVAVKLPADKDGPAPSARSNMSAREGRTGLPAGKGGPVVEEWDGRTPVVCGIGLVRGPKLRVPRSEREFENGSCMPHVWEPADMWRRWRAAQTRRSSKDLDQMEAMWQREHAKFEARAAAGGYDVWCWACERGIKRTAVFDVYGACAGCVTRMLRSYGQSVPDGVLAEALAGRRRLLPKAERGDGGRTRQ